MAGFALDSFEAQAEAFCEARSWREYQFLSGNRPGRGLVGLYEENFPEFTSRDFWADLQAATFEDPRQQKRLSWLLASANLEGNTRQSPISLTRLHATANVTFEETEVPWREVPARWPLVADVPRRHALQEAWRGIWRADLNPILERWQETLRSALLPLSGSDWLQFWSDVRGMDTTAIAGLARSVLDATTDVYGNGLAVYLGQLDLPIDDLWVADAQRAFRAVQFDGVFPSTSRVPTTIRIMRDLGLELEEQTAIRLEYVSEPGIRQLPLHIPADVRVLQHLEGGWRDLARTLRGVGTAEHMAHADPSLRLWERWLGDPTPTRASGLMLEALLRDRTWLMSRLDYPTSYDFRVVAHLARLYRIRRAAARTLYEQRLWAGEPGAGAAADYEESMSAATRVRHFADEYLDILIGAPWSVFKSAFELRAEVFSSQLRAFMQREFDDEWWRSQRAARFIIDELWRPGRRHSAEELLGFMGYEGFDPSILASEVQEVLQPL